MELKFIFLPLCQLPTVPFLESVGLAQLLYQHIHIQQKQNLSLLVSCLSVSHDKIIWLNWKHGLLVSLEEVIAFKPGLKACVDPVNSGCTDSPGASPQPCSAICKHSECLTCMLMIPSHRGFLFSWQLSVEDNTAAASIWKSFTLTLGGDCLGKERSKAKSGLDIGLLRIVVSW